MDKLIVKKDACIGCGICVGENPDYFQYGDDGLSEVTKPEVSVDDKQKIVETIGKCPVEAIVIEEEK